MRQIRARMQRAASLDDVVGDGQQRRREGNAKRLRALEVDHELELGRL
jgi:hypothetical protein